MKMNFPCLPSRQTMPLSLSTRKERDSRAGEIAGQLSSSARPAAAPGLGTEPEQSLLVVTLRA